MKLKSLGVLIVILLSLVSFLCTYAPITMSSQFDARMQAQRASIGNSVSQFAAGTTLVDLAGSTMNDIVVNVGRVSDIIGQIAATSSTQASGIVQINDHVTQMDGVVQQNVALVEKAAAATENFYIDRVPPLAYTEDGIQRGLLWDLSTEMARRVSYTGPITPMPLKRQRLLLSTQSNVIGTMWRYPENEGRYRWLVKLFDFSFFLVAAPDSKVDISSIDAARSLRIGVILGSPAEMLVRRLGFQNIQTSANAETNARKLALGRIDIWIATPAVLMAAQAAVGSALPAPRIGIAIGRLGLYLVSAADYDQQQGEKWSAAFTSMQKDGHYLQIMRKYPGALP